METARSSQASSWSLDTSTGTEPEKSVEGNGENDIGQTREEIDRPAAAATAAADVHRPSFLRRMKQHMSENVRPSLFVEMQLVLLTFCTGLQDAVSFPDYHCFASNQTGNTVFLMLAVIMPDFNGVVFETANIGVALGLFLAAAFITGQIGHIVGARCRWWLICCNLLSTSLVFAAAAMQYVYRVEEKGSHSVAIVGLLAFASGSQVVQSRAFKMTEISTAMATAAWVDLVIDPNVFVIKNRSRTRRAAFLVALFAGSLVGAVIYRYVNSATAIVISGAGKLLVTLLYFFTGEEKTVSTSPV